MKNINMEIKIPGIQEMIDKDIKEEKKTR